MTRIIGCFIYWLLVVVPLSFRRTSANLKIYSFIGVMSIMFFIVVLFVLSVFISPLSETSKYIYLAKFDFPMIQALPIMVFAFTCQVNIFDNYAVLRKPTTSSI